jgi:hypothetical protein
VKVASAEVRYLSARLERFVRAGLTGAPAILAAENREIDIHDFERLVDRGARPGTALRILWPLDDDFCGYGLQDQGDQSRPLATK